MAELLNLFLKIVTLMLIIRHSKSTTCNFKYFKKEWLMDWHLLLVQNSATQRYKLIRDGTIPAKEHLSILCNNRRRPVTVTCQANAEFTPILPLTNDVCTASDALRPVRVEGNTPCPYTMYRIGFDVETATGPQFLETYQVCFDRKHLRPLFTISQAYPVGGSRPEFLKFLPDDIFYPKIFAAFNHPATKIRFNNMLGTPKYMKTVDHIIDRGHLTPSADFAVTNLKRATFKMINVIPQFKGIDNGNWRRIEEWIRDPCHTPANVCTGVFDCDLDAKNNADLNCVVKLQHVNKKWIPIFLADDRKIPIPLWTYKIVKSQESSVVFLTLNNVHHVGEVKVPAKFCHELECPLQLSKSVVEGRTFCCSYHEFIEKVVPTLKNFC